MSETILKQWLEKKGSVEPILNKIGKDLEEHGAKIIDTDVSGYPELCGDLNIRIGEDYFIVRVIRLYPSHPETEEDE